MQGSPGEVEGVKIGGKLASALTRFHHVAPPPAVVIPAHAGIQCSVLSTNLAGAEPSPVDGRRRSTLAGRSEPWIPTFVGMTNREDGARW
jgi:hypothetical protein